MGAELTLIHASGGDMAKMTFQGMLERVMAQQRDANFEAAGQFGMAEISRFWSGQAPKTPPFIVPVTDPSRVQ